MEADALGTKRSEVGMRRHTRRMLLHTLEAKIAKFHRAVHHSRGARARERGMEDVDPLPQKETHKKTHTKLSSPQLPNFFLWRFCPPASASMSGPWRPSQPGPRGHRVRPAGPGPAKTWSLAKALAAACISCSQHRCRHTNLEAVRSGRFR